MSESIPYADIVILALVAGFILLRLRSVLGSKQEGEGPDVFKKEVRPRPQPQDDTVIQFDTKSGKPKALEPDPLAQTLESDKADVIASIKNYDPQFSATHFAEGARRAFEMVFDAFAKGDKSTLKMLLSDRLYDTFSREIDSRQGEDHKTETTLVSVAVGKMEPVSLEKNIARIGMHFASEQVSVVRDLNGQIIGGNASSIQHVDDHWVFERDVTSKSPNWKIIET